MITRILLLIVIIGLVILYIGLEQENKTLLLGGIGTVIFAVVGVGLSIRNKKGMGTLRRL